MRCVTDEAGLDSALGGGGRFAVIFHATWCPFCRAFRPVFERVVGEAKGFEAMEAVIDDEENPLWERFSIDAVPAVLFFDGGRLLGRIDSRLGAGLKEPDLRRALKQFGAD